MKNKIKPFLNRCFICGLKTKNIPMDNHIYLKCEKGCLVYSCPKKNSFNKKDYYIRVNKEFREFEIIESILVEILDDPNATSYTIDKEMFIGSNYECFLYLEKYFDNLEFL